MRFFVQVILISYLFITQTTEGQPNESDDEKEENKKTSNLNFKEFTMVIFNRNQKCLEQSGGTQYYDLRYNECKSCESLENSHQTHTLCPEYQLEKTNKDLEKTNKELEKVNKELEKKLELMELESRKQVNTLSCVVQADHKSYYDEESDECVSCDNCEIGEECQLICPWSKGADPALILSVISIILAIVAIVAIGLLIVIILVRFNSRTLRLQNVEQNNGYEKTPERKRLSARYPQTDGSTLSNESVEIYMGNTTYAGDIAAGYITGKTGPSSGYLSIVDQQNETGYPLLKRMKEKHKKAYEALGKHDPPMFDLYPMCGVSKIQEINPHPDCSKLRDACKGEITQGNAATLIEAMQEKERLLIYNILGNKTQVAISIANAAVDKGYHCIRKTFPSQQENQSTYDEEVYFIKHEIDDLAKPDMSDKPNDPLLEDSFNSCDEPLRAYNYLQEEDVQKKCLVIVQDCDGIDQNQTVNKTGKPCDYLGNVIGGLMFANARVIIISCNPSLCPTTSFKSNLPDRYASVSKFEQLYNLPDRYASVSKTEQLSSLPDRHASVSKFEQLSRL